MFKKMVSSPHTHSGKLTARIMLWVIAAMLPFVFAYIGLANTAPKGVVPQTVIVSFYVGAAILVITSALTIFKVKEYDPETYARYHGIDARAQLALAGNFRGVDDVETGTVLMQRRLNFQRQAFPHFFRRERRVEQENAARTQSLGHLIQVDELPLVAGNEIRGLDEVWRVDRIRTEAQVRRGA